MPSNLLLMVDDLTKDLLGIEDAICLYPSCRNEVPWSITIDEYYNLNKSLTLLIDDIAGYLVDLPVMKTGVSHEAMKKLIRANVSQILYIISDRLIRVLRLLDHNQNAKISLIKVRKFSSPLTYTQLLPLTRDSWEFNQYLVNEILFDKERIEVPQKDVLFPENYWDIGKWANRHGFNYQPQPRSILNKVITLIKNPFPAFVSKSRELLYSTIHKISSCGKSLPIYALGYNEKFMLTKGFFWPLGKLCKLPQSMPNLPNSGIFDSELREHLSEVTKSYFSEKFRAFVRKMGIQNIEADKYLGRISRIFFQLFPVSMLEDFGLYYNWSMEQLKKFKSRHYISWDTANSDISIYYNCAATALGYKVWGIQHSAWGGYLANVPRIAEVSISGADYYITSGWSHSEKHLPSWKIKAVPMSSPYYSEMRKNKKPAARNNSVLLATGEIFCFPPVFYSASFYVDILKQWTDAIEDMINCLREHDIHILLKNYAPNITEILNHYGVISKWLKAGNGNLHIYNKDEKGTAKNIFNKVSATIWDIPSAGFVESILLGTPAFSLWNDDFIRCQPQADAEIAKLIKAGILNANGADTARNVSECIRRDDWWNEPERKQTIDDFMSRFIKTNNEWPHEWKKFLKEVSLANNTSW